MTTKESETCDVPYTKGLGDSFILCMAETAPVERSWNTAQRAMDATPRTFEEFFDAERVRLFKVLFVMTGSRQEAEDLAQESFLRIWQRWDTVGALEDPVGYLHRIAVNLFRDHSRRAAVAVKRAIKLAAPPDAYEGSDDRSLAAQVLGGLAPRQRAALVLTEALGYSSDEAGKLLGIKGSTVRALSFQARAVLKEMVITDG